MNYNVVKLADYSNAFDLLKIYNNIINNTLDENELNAWIEKILKKGDPLAIIKNDTIVAFLLLYCNQLDTLEAYVCNVYVNEIFRGNKLSKLLLEEAINICKSRNFNVINLDVAENNIPARKIYQQCGFVITKHYTKGMEDYVKMTYHIKSADSDKINNCI